jgi:hypothetical protein
MREILQAMSTRGLLEIFGLILLAAALIYVVLRWLRRSGGRPAALAAARTGSQNPEATEEASYGRALTQSVASEDTNEDIKEVAGISPRALGRLRSGREGDRPTENDVVREHMGPRGVPGEPAPANALPENETQMPKPLDPGHTA